MEEERPSTDANGATSAISGAVGFEPRATLNFPVVGIGASAGGVEALEEFFDGAADDSGMAFIVVQHLSPEHQSLMAEILTRHTRMPVVQIADGMAIEPNHVYVIAPGFTLTLAKGRLHLGEPVEKRGHRRPVDDFFRSLAREQKEKAVAVILSGTGTNGTAGAQAIKAAGGICIAQNPESAGFPSMPQSLIHAGYADQVLEARNMAQVIERYAQTPYLDSDADAHAAEDELHRDQGHLREILALLRTRTRHDFSGYRKPTLLRRIQRRMGLNDVARLVDYAALMRDNVEETVSLANDLMINVTGFFRDPEAWEELRAAVIAPLVSSLEEGRGIRAWTAACASGEEPYTLAILIAEELAARGRERTEVKIFATDTADKSLALARSGVYPGGIEADISPERLERYFEKDEHTYRVRKEIREMVVFAPQDLLRDPPFSRVDICTCRNLLIYLEPETQRRVMSLLLFALRDGGYLFLGNTESAGTAHQFEVVSKRWRIYRRIGPTQHRFGDTPSFVMRPAEEIHAWENPSARAARPSATLVVQRMLLERYGPPTLVVDRADQIFYFHGDTQPFMQQPPGEPTRDALVLVRPQLRLAARTVLRSAVRENQRAQARAELSLPDDSVQAIELEAEPLIQNGAAAEYISLSFKVISPVDSMGALREAAKVLTVSHESTETSQKSYPSEIRALQQELQNTIEAFEATSEKLKASNEEATSINEELQSTNEELETGKEELQSVNEELTTVNSQLQSKITELEATTNDLANLLGSTDIAVVFLDDKFNVRQFTPAMRDLLDLIDADIGRPLAALAKKFEDDELLRDARKVLDRLTPIERETKSDSGRWYLRRILPYRTSDNRIQGVVITFVDIVARKLAEELIVSSQQRLQAVLEQMPTAVVIADMPSGEVLFANHVAAGLFQNQLRAKGDRSIEAVIPEGEAKRPSGDIYRLEDWPLARAFSAGEIISEETAEIVFPSGKRQTLSMSASPVRDAQGIAVAVVGTFTDITRTVAIEQRAGEAEDRIRLFLESVSDFAIILLDPLGQVTHWNNGAVSLLGWSSEEAMGRPLGFIFPPEDRDRGAADDELRHARETGRSADDAWLLGKDGSRIWVRPAGIFGSGSGAKGLHQIRTRCDGKSPDTR